MIIVIEGIDGTGKTTVSTRVAQDLGINYRHYPVDYEQAYNLVHDKQMAMALDLVAYKVSEFSDWILDRYMPSSAVYGMNKGLYDTLETLVPVADYNILLTCNPQVAYQRAVTRGLNELDPTELELVTLQEKYIGLGIWDAIIDTTTKTITEVYSEVRQFAKACYNRIL